MKITVTGASGLIGSALCPALERDGHVLTRLVRREPAGPNERRWDPETGGIDLEAVTDADAIVHLAGETIGQRWTTTRRAAILTSRVSSTRLLAETMAREGVSPTLLCASAIGVYGDRGDEELTEASPRGTGFLSEVATEWEAAADPARAAGARVVHLRQGIVLARQGGALERLLLPFRLGLGGRVGSGRQWWSWISLTDAVDAYRFLLTHELDGPVNATAPRPTTNAEFVDALGRALHRPTVLPLPSVAVRVAFGDMGREMLLEGQRVVPRRLLDEGFAFTHPTVDDALAAELAG